MIVHQLGSLIATLALAVPFVQNCELDPGPAPGPDAALPVGEQPCCEQSDEPACDDPEIVACVCALDPFCCDSKWDGPCVTQAAAECGAGCTPG